MNYIGNAFSLGMLDEFAPFNWRHGSELRPELWGGRLSLLVETFTQDEAARWVKCVRPQSCVGHADTALLFSVLLGSEIEHRRETTSLKIGDNILVGQYTGPRLAEGAKALPEGARIRWMKLEVSASKTLCEAEREEMEFVYNNTAW